jgi:CheY-like chemotaxis protein
MSRPTAFVAEDNLEWQAAIADILETEYEVVGFAATSDEVVSAVTGCQPDVLTLDVSMPGISGLNLLPGLRAALSATVIVIVTASKDPSYKEEALKRGASDYITKSRVRQDLLRRLRKHCNERSVS